MPVVWLPDNRKHQEKRKEILPILKLWFRQGQDSYDFMYGMLHPTRGQDPDAISKQKEK